MIDLHLPLGELTLEQVISNKLHYITTLEFINKYHPGIRSETVGVWMRNNKIHYFKPGRERYVVLTKQTLEIKPNKYKTRDITVNKNIRNRRKPSALQSA